MVIIQTSWRASVAMMKGLHHKTKMMSSEIFTNKSKKTRSMWLNCALRGDEAVYWVKRGHLCLFILKKWRSVEVFLMPNSRADFEK